MNKLFLTTRNFFSITLFVWMHLLFSNCTNKKLSSDILTIKALAPVVRDAMPAALVPGAIAAFQISPHSLSAPNANMNYAQGYLAAFFQNYYAVGLANNVQNFILAQLSALDNKIATYSGSQASSHSCLNQSPLSFTLDLSSLNPTDLNANNMWAFPLAQAQCKDLALGNSQTSTSASMSSIAIFGSDDTSTSEWVSFSHSANQPTFNNDILLTAANLFNKNSTSSSTPETVNAMSFYYGGTTGNQANVFWFARFQAIPKTRFFELYFASNQMQMASLSSATGSANGAVSYLGPGFRLISDGSYVYSDGYLCTDLSGVNCALSSKINLENSSVSTITGGNWKVFQVCLTASTLTIVDPTLTPDCLQLANSFVLSPNHSDYTNAEGIFSGNGPITQLQFHFANITGDNNLGDTGIQKVPNLAKLSTSQMNAIISLEAITGQENIKNY